MTNTVTITKIAETAGVSTATVDRVLNNRPGVNPTTVRKVREAMAALGGGAPMRGRPRSTSNYRFAFLLPAGRTAGLLIGRSLPRDAPALCALLSPATRFAAELDRRIGFQQVLEERFPQAKALRLFELPESEDQAYEYARSVLAPEATGGRVDALYNVGPCSFGIARALAEHGYGHDLM